jgi:uroporphyrinogen decarboxylase
VFAEQTHDAGKLYFIHSCGKVDEIMDDLIQDVKIDGKHSFQDSVMPVTEYKDIWGKEVALLGGVDVHKLATMDPPLLKKYIRGIIEKCSEGGRFAIGSGNSVPSYIPLENYLAMIEEARS